MERLLVNRRIRARLSRLCCSIFFAATLFATGCGDKADDVTNTPPSVILGVLNVIVTPAAVVGGSPVQGSVVMNAPPTTGATVTLASSSPVAIVPPSVTVNSGTLNAAFTIATTAVTTPTTVTISATFSGSSRSATLTITP